MQTSVGFHSDLDLLLRPRGIDLHSFLPSTAEVDPHSLFLFQRSIFGGLLIQTRWGSRNSLFLSSQWQTTWQPQTKRLYKAQIKVLYTETRFPFLPLCFVLFLCCCFCFYFFAFFIVFITKNLGFILCIKMKTNLKMTFSNFFCFTTN